MSKFVKWSTAYKNGLPDSAFAHVKGSGDQKVRKLPFKDAEGKVDVPHLRNALVRVAQGKTQLAPAERSAAMGRLKGVAKKYLKSYATTKSGMAMSKYISKFEADVVDRIDALIKGVIKIGAGRKPSDEVRISVKQLALLKDDLETIKNLVMAERTTEPEKPAEKPSEKAEEKKPADKPEEKPAEKPATPPAEPPKETPKETSKKEEPLTVDEEEVSKFQEAVKLCEEYQKSLEEKDVLISKFEAENKDLKRALADKEKMVSKFEQQDYDTLLDRTVEKISKFQNLCHDASLKLRAHYVTSNMSKTALEELGRIADTQMISKLGELKPTTKPTEMLGVNEPAKASADDGKDFSKMSKDEKLDALANLQAKQKGFITE